MDSREVKVFGLIKYLYVKLAVYLNISVLIYFFVIDVLDSRGMLL